MLEDNKDENKDYLKANGMYPNWGYDLMIAISTALIVSSFNESVNKIKKKTPCFLFNMECKVPRQNGFDL
jgi:hypothetical protein